MPNYIWKKKSNHKKKADPVKERAKKLKDKFAEQLQKKHREETAEKGNCCFSLLSCIRNSSKKIPKEYKEILDWLAILSAEQISGDRNDTVMVTALNVSLAYATVDLTDSHIPGDILKIMIEEIFQELKDEYNLETGLESNYEALNKYCSEHNIKIPEVIHRITKPELVLELTN